MLSSTTADPVEALARLDHEAFTKLISANLGPDAPEALWEALTSVHLISRTKSVLIALHTDVQAQLTEANAKLDEAGGPGRTDEFRAAKAGQAPWRRSAAHFQRLVDRRMHQVKAREPKAAPPQKQSPYGPGGTQRARMHTRASLEALARAVAEHQRIVESEQGGPEDDEALWGHLTSVTAITKDGDELPLAKWLEYLDGLRKNDE